MTAPIGSNTMRTAAVLLVALQYSSCALAFMPSSSSTTRRASRTIPLSPCGVRENQCWKTDPVLSGCGGFLVSNKTKRRGRPSSSSSSGSSLAMSVAGGGVTASVMAITGMISAGAMSGSLHAIAGPDHLAALLPRCCGQRWYRAGRIGALWGMGHGVSATVMGILAFGFKSRVAGWGKRWILHGASSFMEVAIGASLVLIGLMGIREALEWKADLDTFSPQSLSAAAVEYEGNSSPKGSVIFNGLLHGLSWDGAPSLAPAVAVATWRGSLTFLLSYALGTMVAMAITTTIIGEGTRRAGEILERPDIPQKLSFISSLVAILVGAVWCGLALK